MKLFRFILFLFIYCSVLNCFAQKEGSVWTFPDSLSISFDQFNNPIVSYSGIGSSGVGLPGTNQSSISDSAGNLLCYAAATEYYPAGLQVFDKNHVIMPNGYGLMGHPNYTCMLIGAPGRDSLITLFHLGRDSVNSNLYHFYYSIININLRGGIGDVILRDSLLYSSLLSPYKLAACEHADGRDWWIVIYDYTISSFITFLFTKYEIMQVNSFQIGSSNNSLAYGNLLFSNDGTKMMAVGPGANGAGNALDVFDFDRCTGLLSNYRDIGENLTSMEYQYFNPAFSPNGNLIYVSPWNVVKVFYQWDLNAGSINDIRNSKTLLNEYPDTGLVLSNTYFAHKLGPDGKMYIPMCNNYFGGTSGNTFVTQHLDVIEYPDTPGIGCNYIRQGLDLGGRRVTCGLPNIPFFGLGAVPGSNCDSLNIGINEKNFSSTGIDVFPNPSSGIFYLKLKDQNDKIISVILQNMMGKEMLVIKNYSSSVDASRLQPGVYIAKIQTRKKKLLVAKLIKQ